MLIDGLLLSTLPSDRMYEFNLNWLLNRIKELSEEWDETRAQWIALKEWVENYFEDTDFVEKIHNALDEMYEDGRLNQIMYQIIGDTALPVFVDSVSQMTNHKKIYVLKSTGHIFTWTGTEWQDTGLAYPNSMGTLLSANIILTADNMQGYTSADEFPNNKIVAFTAGAWRNLSDLPLYAIPQDSVLITYVNSVSTSEPARTQILTTFNHSYVRNKWGNQAWSKWQYVNGGSLISPTSEERVTNIDNIAVDCTYMIQSNVTEDRLTGLPVYGLNGALRTYSYTGTVVEDVAGAIQIFQTERFTYFRMKWGGTWGEWHKQGTNDYIQNTGASTFNDANNVVPNAYSLIMDNITENDIANLPSYGVTGWLLTLSYLDTGAVTNFIQIFITGWNCFFRFKIAGVCYPWRVWGMQSNNLLFLQSTSMAGYVPYQNCDTFPLMSYVVASVTPEQIENMPLYYTPMAIMTYGNRVQSEDGRFQIAYSLQNNEIYYRMSWAGAWTEWNMMNHYHSYNQGTFHSAHGNFLSFMADNTKTYRLISMGDSLTLSTGGGGSRTVASELQNFLVNMYGSNSRTFAGRLPLGVGGAKIVDGLEPQVTQFLTNAPADGTKYIVLIIMGTNDVAEGSDITETCITLKTQVQRIIDTYGDNVSITYVSPLNRHSGGQTGADFKNAVIVSNFTEWINKTGGAIHTINVINGRDIPLTIHTNGSGYDDTNFIVESPDGVHPNGPARSKIASYIFKELK